MFCWLHNLELLHEILEMLIILIYMWNFVLCHSDKYCKSFKFFCFEVKTKQQNVYSEKRLIYIISLFRLIPTQKNLTHSILNNEMKVIKNLITILYTMKLEKTYNAVLWTQFWKFPFKNKKEGYLLFTRTFSHSDLQFSTFCFSDQYSFFFNLLTLLFY